MPHNYIQCRVHIIFSTKDRRRLIPAEVQARLWQYMFGICGNLGVKPIAINGFDDHCHILVGLSATITIADLVQKVKANSSRWMNDEHTKGFAWQENYCLFSVSASHVDRTIAYLKNQREHHKRRSFDDELAAILKKHGIEMVRAVPTGL